MHTPACMGMLACIPACMLPPCVHGGPLTSAAGRISALQPIWQFFICKSGRRPTVLRSHNHPYAGHRSSFPIWVPPKPRARRLDFGFCRICARFIRFSAHFNKKYLIFNKKYGIILKKRLNFFVFPVVSLQKSQIHPKLRFY